MNDSSNETRPVYRCRCIQPCPHRVAALRKPSVRAKNVVPEEYQDVARAIRHAWGADSSSSPSWTTAKPELGHDVVSALLVQHAYGGTLRSGVINGVPHLWNEIEGDVIDLTRAQFNDPINISDEREADRETYLAIPGIAQKFELLLNRVIL